MSGNTHDMHKINFRYQLTTKHVLLLVASLIAGSLFAFHSYTIISRHLEREILQVYKVILNDSLPLPIVTLQLDSFRNPSSVRHPVKMGFNAYLNRLPLGKNTVFLE